MAPKSKPKPSATSAVDIEDLFTALSNLGTKVAGRQVLSVNPGDEDAIRCKVVSLIKADNIDDALSTIVTFSKKYPLDFGFFKVWNTVSLYHLVHTTALVGAPVAKNPNIFGGLLATGTVAFSGT
ncbi:hypothetical protein SSX86_010691 [Deinandra increscens subsp. villosa]|uniref:Uncharacterized protein n=1 Tax=Deinandra increscens subsp. villosa TaxID=3103831 RepID=A0AAP0H2S3_9ASTR